MNPSTFAQGPNTATNAAAQTTTRAQTQTPTQTQTQTIEPQPRGQVLRLGLARRRRVRWRQDVHDNEHDNKKSSKSCCIFHKRTEWDESSCEDSDRDDGDDDGMGGSESDSSGGPMRVGGGIRRERSLGVGVEMAENEGTRNGGGGGREWQRRVRWRGDVHDNEHDNKKSSKSCCVYHPPKAWNESGSETD